MTPEDRDKLIHGMRMLAQGRVNFVETVVDLLVPPQLQTEEVLTMSVDELIAKLDRQEPTEPALVEMLQAAVDSAKTDEESSEKAFEKPFSKFSDLMDKENPKGEPITAADVHKSEFGDIPKPKGKPGPKPKQKP